MQDAKSLPSSFVRLPCSAKKEPFAFGDRAPFYTCMHRRRPRPRTSEVKWGKTGRTSDISVNGRFNADGDGDGDKAEGGKGFLKLPDRHAAAGINRVGLSGRTHSGIHFPLKIP